MASQQSNQQSDGDTIQHATHPNVLIQQSQTLNQQKLDDIIAKRKGKVDYIDPAIQRINKNTVRIISDVENFITKKNEFRYRDYKAVKPAIPYHIHYTIDLSEYYMTGYEHNKESKIIYKIKSPTNFSYYNLLNKQSRLKIPETRVLPTDEDYDKGSYIRHFAVVANNIDKGGFEISEDDYETSPLYLYVKLNWKLTGKDAQVIVHNVRQLRRAEKIIPNIRKIASKAQYYKMEENLTPKDTVKRKLGI